METREMRVRGNGTGSAAGKGELEERQGMAGATEVYHQFLRPIFHPLVDCALVAH